MKRKSVIITRCIIAVLVFVLSGALMACGSGGKKPTKPESESTSKKETQKQTTTTAQTTTQAPTETTSATEAETDEETRGEEYHWSSDYSIDVNLAYCTVTVYENNADGSRTPINVMACSCGREGCETPTGSFYTSDQYYWGYMADGSWAQYCTRFNNDILFHSVPSWDAAPGNIEIGEYNKLGGPASLGCVRLCVADAAWIYYNMPWGTEVNVFYDWNSAGPWGKPGSYKIPDDISPLNQWDPTDPADGNPWYGYYITIDTNTITLPSGSNDNDLYNKVSIIDCYNNNVKRYAYIEFDGDYNVPGNYYAYASIYLGNGYAEEYIPVTITE
ncbi:MAG: L,D-transpeptidase [Lachnospiraceae bacterium]|nr:L,D-transpeptidase [Lachnospiraceae bacterium]